MCLHVSTVGSLVYCDFRVSVILQAPYTKLCCLVARTDHVQHQCMLQAQATPQPPRKCKAMLAHAQLAKAGQAGDEAVRLS